EDAVAEDHKALARDHIMSWLARDGRALVRVNGVDSPHHNAHCRTLAGVRGLQGVMLPKATSAADVEALQVRLRGIPVVALIESAAGLAHVDDVATAEGVARLRPG